MRKQLSVVLALTLIMFAISSANCFAAKQSVTYRVSCIMPETANVNPQLSENELKSQQPQTQVIREKTYHNGQLVLLTTVVTK